jgi:hypothetical protein
MSDIRQTNLHACFWPNRCVHIVLRGDRCESLEFLSKQDVLSNYKKWVEGAKVPKEWRIWGRGRTCSGPRGILIGMRQIFWKKSPCMIRMLSKSRIRYFEANNDHADYHISYPSILDWFEIERSRCIEDWVAGCGSAKIWVSRSTDKTKSCIRPGNLSLLKDLNTISQWQEK